MITHCKTFALINKRQQKISILPSGIGFNVISVMGSKENGFTI